MKRQAWSICFLVLVGLFVLAPAQSQARVYIDINAPYARLFPVAVPYLKPLGGAGGDQAAQGLVETLTSDLDFCGLFKTLDSKGFLENYLTMGLTAAATNFQAWKMIGAEFLVKGGYTSDGTSFVCELRFFDVRRGQLLTGKRYTGTVNDFRLIAHKFADEIMLQITGEKGVFQTRLAFVSTSTGYKEIYVSDFDGHAAAQYTKYRSISLDPAWSPDGRTLAFTSYKDGQPYLYTLDLASRKVTRILNRKGLNITPAYSPQGDKMAVTLSPGGDPEIYL
ncbi:MAG: PD40 domain-containing protein, partial [Deltaproteobacteria bacterium]|nr:PD40 domain-containing protein [Deltaproteobacteria bacterium]